VLVHGYTIVSRSETIAQSGFWRDPDLSPRLTLRNQPAVVFDDRPGQQMLDFHMEVEAIALSEFIGIAARRPSAPQGDSAQTPSPDHEM